MPELIQLRLTSWASSKVWSQQPRHTCKQAGCLPQQEELPLGLSHQKSLPPNLNHGQPEEPDTRSQTCQRRVHYSTNVDTHINLHTALSCEDSRVLGVTLLNFSLSFPTLVLPLSWQKLLAPLPPAITLSLSLSSLSFQLPCVFFPLSLTLCSFTLFKLLTSNPSILLTAPGSFCYIPLLFHSPIFSTFYHLHT